LKLLAISGSLRQASSNTALLRAAQQLAPEHITLKLYDGLGDLPHFNPDIEFDDLRAVAQLKAKVEWADGLIFSTPEYAHGLPGSFKNLLDWLVGGHEFYQKPVTFFHLNAERGQFARAQLQEIIKTMSAKIIDEACLILPVNKALCTAEITTHAHHSLLIKNALTAFEQTIQKEKTSPA
jgi:NAD(P)H-dependent FMN reductase